LGIAETVVNTLLIGVVASLAAAFALAFGLGGQRVAGQITQGWYEKGQEAGQKVAQEIPRSQSDEEPMRSADEPIPAGGTTDTPADRPAPESGR